MNTKFIACAAAIINEWRPLTKYNHFFIHNALKMELKTNTADFCIGEVIKHKLFGYYGVIYDVDPVFMGPDDWYEAVAKSRPPKDQPWYHVLVDGSDAATYVAERNLKHCSQFKEINHSLLNLYFNNHNNKVYLTKLPVA